MYKETHDSYQSQRAIVHQARWNSREEICSPVSRHTAGPSLGQKRWDNTDWSWGGSCLHCHSLYRPSNTSTSCCRHTSHCCWPEFSSRTSHRTVEFGAIKDKTRAAGESSRITQTSQGKLERKQQKHSKQSVKVHQRVRGIVTKVQVAN